MCRGWRRAAGQQVLAWLALLVDAAPYDIPYFRSFLPFVYQQGVGPRQYRCWISGNPNAYSTGVEKHSGGRPPLRRRRLADSLGAINGDGWEGAQEQIKLIVNDSVEVVQTLNPADSGA